MTLKCYLQCLFKEKVTVIIIIISTAVLEIYNKRFCIDLTILVYKEFIIEIKIVNYVIADILLATCLPLSTPIWFDENAVYKIRPSQLFLRL